MDNLPVEDVANYLHPLGSNDLQPPHASKLSIFVSTLNDGHLYCKLQQQKVSHITVH